MDSNQSEGTMTREQIDKIQTFLDQYPDKTIFLYSEDSVSREYSRFHLLIGRIEHFKGLRWTHHSREEAVKWKAVYLGVIDLKEHNGLKASASIDNYSVYYKAL